MSRALAILTALFALVLLAPRAARAADAGASANESTVSVVPSVQVRVRTVGRAVRVTGWARSDVKVSSADDVPNLQVSDDRSRVTVSASVSGGAIDLFVPAASHVEVHTVGGAVSVLDVTGAIRATTVDGQLTVRGAPREVDAESVSGNVDLDLAACAARASSISGSVRVQCKGKTASRIYGKTVSGSLAVSGVTFERIELRTVSGRVDADGKVAGDGPFELRSHSGDVTLSVPKGTPLVLDARSTRGRIEATAKAGPNAPTVTLRSFSGDVRVVEK